MWFVFDADDFFEGGAGMIMLIFKLALILMFVLLPIQFFDIANRAPILSISFGLTIVSLIFTIIALFYLIKVYKNNDEYALSKINLKNIVFTYIILFVILSLVGYMFPLVLHFGTYKLSINKISSMIMMPTLLNLVFIFYIKSDFKEYRKDKRVKRFFQNLKEFIFKTLRITFIPVFVVYWIIMILSLMSDEGTKMYNFTNGLLDYGNKYYTYYDTKYEKEREKKDVNGFIEAFVLKVKNEYYYDEEAKQHVNDLMPNRVGERIDHYWQEQDDVKIFTFVYLTSIYGQKNDVLTKYGIAFKDATIVDTSTIAIHYFDKMTLRDEYILFNLDTNKIKTEITSSDFVNYDFINHRRLWEK